MFIGIAIGLVQLLRRVVIDDGSTYVLIDYVVVDYFTP